MAGRLSAPALAVLIGAFLTGTVSAHVTSDSSVVTRQSGPQESEIAGVTTEIAYLRQYDGALHVGVLLKNTGGRDAASSSAIDFSRFTLVEGSRKHFPLKGPDGRYVAGPISDWNGGGRIFPRIPANGQLLVWAVFEPIPAKQVDVSLPLSQPFDSVPIADGPPPAGEVGTVGMLRASLSAATRTEGEVKVRVKVANPGRRSAVLPAIQYSDAYLLDPQSRKKYPLVKDEDGRYQAQPISDANGGGRLFLQVAPGAQKFIALTFNAPPDEVDAVDVVVPEIEPFEHVALAGAGHARDSGVAVAGRTIGLEKALADLHADVTPQQVKVNLSADVLFDFDKADLKPEAAGTLGKVAVVMTAYPGATMQIDGYTDAKGTHTYNQRLSERRAASVADWLVTSGGVDRAQITTRGFGDAKPIAPNTKPDGSDDPDGRAKNRRVEITIAKPAPDPGAPSGGPMPTAPAAVAAGASPGPRYPLTPGTRWTYQERQQVGKGVRVPAADEARAHGGVIESTVISTVKGSDPLGAVDYVRIDSTREGRLFLKEWYRPTPGGLVIGKRADLGKGGEIAMQPPQQVLSASLQPGESWHWRSADDPSWAIERRVIRRGTVTVPAGAYSGVELDTILTVRQGPVKLTVHERSWFVPDVGFVSRDMEATAGGRFVTRVTQRLEKFEPADGRPR